MYVVISTYRNWENGTETIKVGAVYGPFDTKIDAMAAKNDLDFPSPELVEIRQIHQP